VRDDVVQLAGDPRPLFGDGRTRALLPLALGCDRAVLEPPLAQAPVPDRPAGQPWAAYDQEEEDIAAERRPVGVRRRRDERQGKRGEGARDGPGAGGVRADGIDGDDKRDRRSNRVFSGERNDERGAKEGGGQHPEDDERDAPAPDERKRGDERKRHAQESRFECERLRGPELNLRHRGKSEGK